MRFVETQEGPLINLEHVLLLAVEPRGSTWELLATALAGDGEFQVFRVHRGLRDECESRKAEILRADCAPAHGPTPAPSMRPPIHGVVRGKASCKICGVRAWVWVRTRANREARQVCIGCDHTADFDRVPLKVRYRAVDAFRMDEEG
jgi:hypothetical protein